MSKPYLVNLCCTGALHSRHRWPNGNVVKPDGPKCCCGQMTYEPFKGNAQCKMDGCYYVNAINSVYCVKHKEYRCKNCGDTVTKAPGTNEPFCSRECSIAWDNNVEQNGHRAAACPVAVNVTSVCDSRSRYAHGDCTVVKLPNPQEYNNVLQFVMGNTEYTIEGQATAVDTDYGFASDEIHVKVRGTVTTRQIHDNPHYQANVKHGNLCVCRCSDCWEPNRHALNKMICTCGGCGLKGAHH